MKRFFINTIIVLSFTFTACREEKVIINKDYVINPNWNDSNNNVLEVVKLKLKNKNEGINPKTATITEIGKKLEEDSTFSYSADVNYNGIAFSKRKIYFNSDNGFLWLSDLHNSSTAKRILGELETDTWYLLAGLSNVRTLYYIYIDNQGNVNIFVRMASNI